ncbi:hypothetical protein [Lysinibacillus sp. RC79]|uniref:hypothetical protein n=1 Tax=Lysinibacillus sp. RC79 TaxID=3156296 RepID=UPI0035177C3D
MAPNIPQCVLENWIYRHYSCVMVNYSFLKFEKMHFLKENWSIEKIYHEINSYEKGMINELGYQIYRNNEKSWLQKYMLENMTWPIPIIVIENKESQLINSQIVLLGCPFHLVEGHLRLNYFREMYRTEKENLKKIHQIWRIAIEI